eukprot:4573782-Amphidinium_carterae.1
MRTFAGVAYVLCELMSTVDVVSLKTLECLQTALDLALMYESFPFEGFVGLTVFAGRLAFTEVSTLPAKVDLSGAKRNPGIQTL